jgi:NAD+ diphosphatase
VQSYLRSSDYEKGTLDAASKIRYACLGDERAPKGTIEEKTELSTPTVPGPYAIAHHLIATWANEGAAHLISKV